MNVYVCRWPNGNFSAVHADSMRAAMSLLDGVESVSPTRLVKVDDFVVHFNLRLPKCDCESVPEFEVVSFGSQTFQDISSMYPEMGKAQEHIDRICADIVELNDTQLEAMHQLVTDAFDRERGAISSRTTDPQPTATGAAE